MNNRKQPSLEDLGLDEPTGQLPVEKISIEELQRQSERENEDRRPQEPPIHQKPVFTRVASPNRTGGLAAIIGLAVVVLLCAGLLSPRQDDSETSDSTASFKAMRHIQGSDFIGCTDRAQYQRIVRFAVQKDAIAFEKAIVEGLASGTCTEFRHGETVYIVEGELLSGLVKIRRQGEIVEYWTAIEAIR